MATRFLNPRRSWRCSVTPLGVPRVINLLCEHCLVSAFVDQKKTVSAEIVDAVAKDFDLSDGTTAAAMTPRGSASLIGESLT